MPAFADARGVSPTPRTLSDPSPGLASLSPLATSHHTTLKTFAPLISPPAVSSLGVGSADLPARSSSPLSSLGRHSDAREAPSLRRRKAPRGFKLKLQDVPRTPHGGWGRLSRRQGELSACWRSRAGWWSSRTLRLMNERDRQYGPNLFSGRFGGAMGSKVRHSNHAADLLTSLLTKVLYDCERHMRFHLDCI